MDSAGAGSQSIYSADFKYVVQRTPFAGDHVLIIMFSRDSESPPSYTSERGYALRRLCSSRPLLPQGIQARCVARNN